VPRGSNNDRSDHLGRNVIGVTGVNELIRAAVRAAGARINSPGL